MQLPRKFSNLTGGHGFETIAQKIGDELVQVFSVPAPARASDDPDRTEGTLAVTEPEGVQYQLPPGECTLMITRDFDDPALKYIRLDVDGQRADIYEGCKAELRTSDNTLLLSGIIESGYVKEKLPPDIQFAPPFDLRIILPQRTQIVEE
ncbi:hypothetical protein TI05_13730 [Achromatium sp. WMS3]|nr:hypothetical protein TI05_13730 [Achromatium sp. WMS3]